MQNYDGMVCRVCGEENPDKHQDFCKDLDCSGLLIMFEQYIKSYTKTLFIGGSYDGTRQDVDAGMDVISMAVREDAPSSYLGGEALAAEAVVMHEVYKRELLADSHRRYPVYVIMNDEQTSLIERLIRGYNKERKS